MTLEGFLKAIGQNIAKYRKAKPITQRDVSAQTGISYRYYQSIEAGSANITLATLHRLSTFLEVHPGDLMPER